MINAIVLTAMKWWQHITITQWLPQITKKDIKADVVAGLTVGIILVPQGIAYAMIAGLPLFMVYMVH